MRKSVKFIWSSLLTVFWAGSFILIVSTAPVLAGAANPINGQKTVTRYDRTDQLIIRYKDSTLVKNAVTGNIRAASTMSVRLGALSDHTGIRLTHQRYMSGNGHIVKLPAIMTLAEAESVAARLRTNPDIAYVEPDRRMRPMLIPNDPQYVNQWHYKSPNAPDNVAGGANLPGAWDRTTGSGSVVVAVIDTGILPNHADIAGRTLPGYNFISNPAMAGNDSGRSADSTDLGDFVTATESTLLGCEEDNSSWHGTHVAGTIGAASNNGIGSAGINWVSPILPVRAMGKCGGLVSDIADGMRWAAGIHVDGVTDNINPAKVLNMSLGGSGACGSTFQNAVNDVIATGATIVVAAGNSNDDVSNYSPANCNGVISVSATSPSGGRTYYSNFGTVVKIAAPGGDFSAGATKGVLSTLNSGLTTAVASPGGDTYKYYQGTSMATPHVAGIVSLMLSLKPTLTSEQILNLLQSNARTFPVNTISSGDDCTTLLCGTGIIDAAAAVNSVNNPILTTSTITSITATSATSGGNITSDGGTAVSARGVCWHTASNPTIANTCTNNGTGTGTFSSSISGLSINATYYIRAYATNASGTTYGNEQILFTSQNHFLPRISTSTVSDITPTSAISGGTILSDGGAAITARGVCWSNTVNPTTANNCSNNGTGTGSFSNTITGLTSGQTYHVKAYASNEVGTAYGVDQNFSTSSDPPTVLTSSATLITNSTAVSGGNITLGGGASISARGVCWGTSANPAISGSCTADGTGTGQFSSPMTGLASATQYHIRAYATNVNNTTSYGSDLTFRTLAAPTRPTVLTAMPMTAITTTSATGGGNITSDGGSAVTLSGVCWSTSANPIFGANCTLDGPAKGKFTRTITGLSTNTLYHIRAFATNALGTSYGRDVHFTTGKRPVKFILFAPR